MRRRSLLWGSLGALATCGRAGETPHGSASAETHRWRMVTSWPPKFPGFGASAERLAQRIGALSDGRLEIEVFAAGELIPTLEVFMAANTGAQMGGWLDISEGYFRGV